MDRRNRESETPPPGRKITRYEDEREENRQRRGQTYRDAVKSHNGNSRNKEYYKQFNTREEEITKNKRGVVVRQDKTAEPHEEDWGREDSKDETETDQQGRKEESTQKIPPGLNTEQEIIISLAAKFKYYSDHNWEFKRIIQELVDRPERKELEIKNAEEAGKVKKNITKEEGITT